MPCGRRCSTSSATSPRSGGTARCSSSRWCARRTRSPRRRGWRRELPEDSLRLAAEDPEHLTSVQQEGLPDADTLEELLGHLAWPDVVDGAAVVVERMVVPPEAESGMPADPEAALDYLMHHPDREDVRMAAGVLRTGESWCVLRTRSHDSDDAVAGAPDAVPGLVEALRATFA